MFVAIADPRGDSEFAYIRTSPADLSAARQLFWGQGSSAQVAVIFSGTRTRIAEVLN
ncbi:MAG: hypothetical protein ABSD08_09480 [Xanthobacteraceae bacterium]|jgi:hypothetical protein